MKLLRTGEPGKEKPAVLLENKIMDVSSFGEDFGERFFESDGLERLRKWLKDNSRSLAVVQGNVRMGPPFQRPSKIICIGLNYSDHARETGAQLPTEPVIFFNIACLLSDDNRQLNFPISFYTFSGNNQIVIWSH